jgi:hypothetical protein
MESERALVFYFDAFSSREPVPTEPVIGRAFARPVGSKTLYRKSSCPAFIGGKRGSIGEQFDRRPLKTTINEVPEGL